MSVVVYVRLLNEGTVAFRPVPAVPVSAGVYLLGGDDWVHPEDEEWEFPPGARVRVGNRLLDGASVLVAEQSE